MFVGTENNTVSPKIQNKSFQKSCDMMTMTTTGRFQLGEIGIRKKEGQ